MSCGKSAESNWMQAEDHFRAYSVVEAAKRVYFSATIASVENHLAVAFCVVLHLLHLAPLTEGQEHIEALCD